MYVDHHAIFVDERPDFAAMSVREVLQRRAIVSAAVYKSCVEPGCRTSRSCGIKVVPMPNVTGGSDISARSLEVIRNDIATNDWVPEPHAGACPVPILRLRS